MIGVRLNVRTRTRLFAALLRAEAGFFDAARLGDLVSRLSADTATVSDNRSLQLNVLARSAIGGAVVLGFMVRASWRLSVLAALVLPAIAAVSKVFGRIYRDLAKRSQAALADANAAAEEVLATMATVKAHAAEGAARASYGAGLASFQAIQAASGRAYAVYALASTGLPALLATGVLAAGGIAWAAPWAKTYSLATATVAVSNERVNKQAENQGVRDLHERESGSSGGRKCGARGYGRGRPARLRDL